MSLHCVHRLFIKIFQKLTLLYVQKTLGTNNLQNQEYLEKQKKFWEAHHRDANIEFCEIFLYVIFSEKF